MKRITVDILNKKAKKKDIWCLGCGKRLYEMIELYKDEYFVKKINGLYDNNSRLWGFKKNIAGRDLMIESPLEMVNKSGILLITSDHYRDIYSSIKDVIDEKRIECYIYPHFYYSFTSWLMNIVGMLPMKRQILFYAGNEPHENADEVARYLYEDYKGKKYSVVYLEEVEERNHSYNIKSLNKWIPRTQSSLKKLIRYCFLYGRSEYLMYENEAIEKISSKQKLVYLNHGLIPLKNVRDVLKQPDNLDYALCPGEGCSRIYKEQYGIPKHKQIYIFQPRIDRIFKARTKYDTFVTRDGEQIILWMPTFRQLAGSERVDSVKVDPIELIRSNIYEVDQWLRNNNQKLIIKKHPREKIELAIPSDIKNIIEIREQDLQSRKVVIQDLLADTDALITDYSSIAFEYMLINRPIGYITCDYNEYFRGFSVSNPLEYMPGEKINTTDEFKSFLEMVHSGKDRFCEDRNNLKKRLFGNTVCGKGTESLIKFLDGGRYGK